MNGQRRPFFNYSTSELEAVFKQASSDATTLRALELELSFRTTAQAGRLRASVQRASTALEARQTNSASTTKKEPAQPEGVAPTFRDSSSSESPLFPQFVVPEARAEVPTRRAAVPAVELPPTIAFDNLSEPVATTGADQPARILQAWIALEALAPVTYKQARNLVGGDQRCVADFSKNPLPWIMGETSRPKRQLFYHVILGAIPMDRATDDLVKAFGEDEDYNSRSREKAAIASVLVDRNGIPLEEGGIVVSSFAWALPLAIQLKLGALGVWPKVEPSITAVLERILRRRNRDNVPIPLDLAVISAAHRWLVAQFKLPAHLVEAPSLALRVYHYYKAKAPPEPLLLNSFFMGDLARCNALVNQDAVPAGLRRYLGIDKLRRTFDLLNDDTAVEKAVAPTLVPPARWPSAGGHPLVLRQQAAVNVARAELVGTEGIIGINGPPGTGKTTLLREVVAASVLDRALAMAKFDDPERAFTASGQRAALGNNRFHHLYTLSPSLRGHEILVASSNNKAVENVSRALPAATAIGRKTEALSYFKSVSDAVYGPRGSGDDGALEDENEAESIETWGLIAAVLGNRGNVFSFQQTFWWDDARSMRLYLKAAKGESVVIETTDAAGRVIERIVPSVVTNENPPATPELAKSNWRKAKERLAALKRQVDREIEGLEALRSSCLRLAEIRHELPQSQAALARLWAQHAEAEATHASRQQQASAARAHHGRAASEDLQHYQSRPGFFSRLFGTQKWHAWSDAYAPLVSASNEAAHKLRDAERAEIETRGAVDSLQAEIRTLERRLTESQQAEVLLTREIDAHRRKLGPRLLDEEFFRLRHEVKNLTAPWISDDLHRKREELFIAAIGVHRAFIDASAQKVLHNLSVLMNVFRDGPPSDAAKRALLGDLWSTLFLVTPVVSTTFASVERMLGALPPGSLGWLLIDEAGQALPQAAIGAVMRAKRTVVVGDPMQIPPVVTLPERLNAKICEFFRVEKSTWAAPEASAQTLADRASRFQAAFRSAEGSRRVGVPLLVHRRCQEPMFGISNRIAYDGQMVHAPAPHIADGIELVLGPSRWLDVDGAASSKWCPAEGEVVVALLKKIAVNRIKKPDLFIVTPFRVVAQEMRERLEREQEVFLALEISAGEWLKDRVGTIHTVQGREADSVIFVLGAPNASQHRARSWAAGTPNILNVAVSRAKRSLYVVGSWGAWAGVGHTRELASLPRDRQKI